MVLAGLYQLFDNTIIQRLVRAMWMTNARFMRTNSELFTLCILDNRMYLQKLPQSLKMPRL